GTRANVACTHTDFALLGFYARVAHPGRPLTDGLNIAWPKIVPCQQAMTHARSEKIYLITPLRIGVTLELTGGAPKAHVVRIRPVCKGRAGVFPGNTFRAGPPSGGFLLSAHPRGIGAAPRPAGTKRPAGTCHPQPTAGERG